jgi:hypothetical protein
MVQRVLEREVVGHENLGSAVRAFSGRIREINLLLYHYSQTPLVERSQLILGGYESAMIDRAIVIMIVTVYLELINQIEPSTGSQSISRIRPAFPALPRSSCCRKQLLQ